MNGKLLKTINHYLRTGRFLKDKLNKSMTFLHKVLIVLTSCNIRIFIIYMPAFQDTFI